MSGVVPVVTNPLLKFMLDPRTVAINKAHYTAALRTDNVSLGTGIGSETAWARSATESISELSRISYRNASDDLGRQ